MITPQAQIRLAQNPSCISAPDGVIGGMAGGEAGEDVVRDIRN